jgi:hypothetical protein
MLLSPLRRWFFSSGSILGLTGLKGKSHAGKATRIGEILGLFWATQKDEPNPPFAASSYSLARLPKMEVPRWRVNWGGDERTHTGTLAFPWKADNRPT